MEYFTESGIPCTEEENKLIDSLKRLASKWKKHGKDLQLFSWAGSLYVLKLSELDFNNFERALIEHISGISNDGGDP